MDQGTHFQGLFAQMGRELGTPLDEAILTSGGVTQLKDGAPATVSLTFASTGVVPLPTGKDGGLDELLAWITTWARSQ